MNSPTLLSLGSAVEASRPNSAPLAAAMPTTPTPELVLVVDDNPATRAVTVRPLSGAGFAVAEASDGETGLGLIRALRPALVLLDVVMPDLSGLDVLRLIRADTSLADIPVLLLTAQPTSPHDLSMGLDSGADDYLRQPVSAAELIARVRLHLRHKRTETDLKASESRLATAQALAHLGSWELDLNTMTGTWSKEMCHLCYWDPSRPAPTFAEFLERVHPNDRPQVEESLVRLSSATEAFDVEFRTHPSFGPIRHLSATIYVVRDALGQVRRATGTALDITEKKHSAKAIAELSERTAKRERMLSTALASMSDFAQIYDRDGRILFVNQPLLKLWGLTMDEVIGKNFNDLGYPRDLAEKLLRQLREVITTGQRLIDETAYTGPDGTLGYYEYIFSPALDSDDTVAFVVGCTRDITARKQAEAGLQTSEAEFRLLSEAMPQIVWITRADGWNIYFNQRWTDYTGLTLEESRGHGWNKPFHPDDQHRAWDAWQRATATGGSYSLECRLRRADGAYQWWLVRGVPQLGPTGEILKWFGTCTDINEFKRAQVKIAEHAALIDLARDGIVVRDLDHRITFWSKGAERIFGWTVAEAVGRRIHELILPTAATFDQAHATVLREGAWSGEIQKTTKAGTVLTLDASWTLLRDAEGKPKEILTIDSDITARKKLEQQFLRAQRMESLGTLAGGIAHDLNNLLSPITVGVGLLKALDPSPKSIQVIDNIERSARRGADLVKQVLSFARGVEGSRVSIQVAHIVKEVESIACNTFPKDIVVESDVPSTLWTILADPTQINQVVLNLAVNARDAMPDGGRLELSASNVEIDQQYAVMNGELGPGRYVMIQVTDNGHGMPKEIIDRIFEPFFTTKEQGKGTGLGLSTTLGIVRSHGGFVNVYSELGKGSVFKVYLPAMGDSAKEKMVFPGEPTLPRGNGELVLVVDDETSILSVTKQTLQTFGYRVLTAEDGAQAISQYALQRSEIAAVLTDMMMPVMDGLVLIAALQRINPQVRIIAASGLNAHGKATRAAVAGVKHFLAKPYSADALLATLRKTLTEKEVPS